MKNRSLHLFWYLCLILLSCVLSSIPPNNPFFLKSIYRVKDDERKCFYVRQVPGDGGCLFHSIATWLAHSTCNQHLEFDWRLRKLSNQLRQVAVSVLQTNQSLYIENGDIMDSPSLLAIVGEHYNMTPSEYCSQMLCSATWGGGPEIVALSNHFQCPIHVYNLCSVRGGCGSDDGEVAGETPSTNLSRRPPRSFTWRGLRGFFSSIFHKKKSFRLKLCAKFGSPVFDHRHPIQILCADGRFPHITPGSEKEVGDHFMPLFPCELTELTTAEAVMPTASVVSSSSQRSWCTLLDCPKLRDSSELVLKPLPLSSPSTQDV
eukprot:gene39081-47547_t